MAGEVREEEMKSLHSDLLRLARRFHAEALDRANSGYADRAEPWDKAYRKLMEVAREMEEEGLRNVA